MPDRLTRSQGHTSPEGGRGRGETRGRVARKQQRKGRGKKGERCADDTEEEMRKTINGKLQRRKC